ncbi:uncharacterized protein [Epargyreus clarus]|uniref:uncharacterized protein n=1 Tax=Epargyreus clarus TaxID=520877 RepID=UPI003C2B0574
MVVRSQCPKILRDTRIMLLILVCCLAAAAAAPATYDQRQTGEANHFGEIKNVAILVALPQNLPSIPLDILDGLVKLKSNGREAAQDRADVQLTGAFVEPSTPYKVEIGLDGSERSAAGDGRAVEVVIAGRRRSEVEPQPEKDEVKLLGATEECGPDRVRDSVTLMCRQRSEIQPEKTPEVIPSS